MAFQEVCGLVLCCFVGFFYGKPEFDVEIDETDYLNRLVQKYELERKQYTRLKQHSRQTDQREQKKM